MTFKIAILASTNGTTFAGVLAALKAGELPGVEIAALVTDHADCGAAEKARAAGISVIVAEKAKNPDVGEVDLICCMGYMRILSGDFVRKWEGRILNVHPSLLPKYGGAGWMGMKVHEAVIANGDAESGMTIHIVTDSVDGGSIFLQKKVVVGPGETAESLKTRVQQLEVEGYIEAILKFQHELDR